MFEGESEKIALLREWQALCDKLGAGIRSGPAPASIEEYCTAVGQIMAALKVLETMGMGHCSVTRDALQALETNGIDKLGVFFSSLLDEMSTPIDLLVARQTDMAVELPSPDALQKLSLVANFFGDLDKPSRLYVDARGRFLAGSFQPLLTKDEAFSGQYQRGSHPLILGLKMLGEVLVPIEKQLIDAVMPGSTDLLARTLKPLGTLINGHVGSLAREAAVQCEEKLRFSDFIFLFDILEEVHRARQLGPELSLALSQPFTALLDACQLWLADLKRTVASRTFGLPVNATVYEATSLAVSCLRRLAEYETIVEAVLAVADARADARSSTSSTTSSFLNPDSVVAVSFFFKEVMESAITSFTGHAAAYPRTSKGNYFLLNNYNYMLLAIRGSSRLTALVPMGVEERFEGAIGEAINLLSGSWKAIADQLNSPGMDPKDRLKTFSGSLMELYTLTQGIAIPSPELRETLRLQMQRSILPLLQAFYNQYSNAVSAVIV